MNQQFLSIRGLITLALLSLLGLFQVNASNPPTVIAEHSFGDHEMTYLYRSSCSKNGQWIILSQGEKAFVWNVKENTIKTMPDGLTALAVSDDGTIVGKDENAQAFYGKFTTDTDYKYLNKDGEFAYAIGITPDSKHICGMITSESDEYKFKPVVWTIGETVTSTKLPKLPMTEKYGLSFDNATAFSMSDDGKIVAGIYSQGQYLADGYYSNPRIIAIWKYDDASSSYIAQDVYSEYLGKEEDNGKFFESDFPSVSHNGKYVVCSANGKGLVKTDDNQPHFATMIYQTDNGSISFIKEAPYSSNASGKDIIASTILDDGTVFGYTGEERIVWNSKAFFKHLDDNAQSLESLFTSNKIEYPRIVKDVDLAIGAYVNEGKTYVVLFSMVEESNPTVRIIELPSSNTSDPSQPTANAPFEGGKQLSASVWQYHKRVGSTDEPRFLRKGHITNNYEYVYLGFDSYAGAGIWNVKTDQNISGNPEDKVYPEAVASNGLIGGQQGDNPVVGTDGGWVKLSMEDNRYGSVEALSDDAHYAAGWSCINESKVCEAHVWNLLTKKRYNLPLPTMDEYGVLLQLPKPVSISDNGKVVVANAVFEEYQTSILWIYNEDKDAYDFVDMHKGYCDFNNPDNNYYLESIASAVSGNGEWVCGTYRGKIDLKDSEEGYYGFVYNVPNRTMKLMRYKEEGYQETPIQLFDIANNGIVVGAQTGIGAVTGARAIYGDAVHDNTMKPLADLFMKNGVNDYKFGVHGSLVNAISPDAKALVVYEITGGETPEEDENTRNKDVNVFYFANMIESISSIDSYSNAKVYPTLFDNQLTIDIDNNLVGSNIFVYALDGSIQYTGKALSNQQNIDLSHLHSGIYLIKIGNYTTKITKK